MKYFRIFLISLLIVVLGVLGLKVLDKSQPTIDHYRTHQASSGLESLVEETIQCRGIFIKICDLNLTTKISEPEVYRDVLQILREADDNTTIRFHLIGDGGEIRTLYQLVYNVKTTKANTEMIVEGPIYSAHAYLALTGDKLVISSHSTFLFHHTSLYEATDFCDEFKGQTDRGQDSAKKCEAFVNHAVQSFELFIRETTHNVLTPTELLAVLYGHDVIISGKEIQKRFDNRR